MNDGVGQGPVVDEAQVLALILGGDGVELQTEHVLVKPDPRLAPTLHGGSLVLVVLEKGSG